MRHLIKFRLNADEYRKLLEVTGKLHGLDVSDFAKQSFLFALRRLELEYAKQIELDKQSQHPEELRND